MSRIPCRQCERCELSLGERRALLDSQDIAASGLIPDGVEILDHYVHSVGVTCAACGCPQSGSLLLGVLVRSEAVAAMREAGRDPHR